MLTACCRRELSHRSFVSARARPRRPHSARHGAPDARCAPRHVRTPRGYHTTTAMSGCRPGLHPYFSPAFCPPVVDRGSREHGVFLPGKPSCCCRGPTACGAGAMQATVAACQGGQIGRCDCSCWCCSSWGGWNCWSSATGCAATGCL